MKVRFPPFLLDSGARQLLKGTEAIRLSPKAFDVLQILVERRPDMVSKEELLTRVWPSTFVEEANLGNAVVEIRRALGDSSTSRKFVRTVHGRGFAFCAAAEQLPVGEKPPAGPYPRWWLMWNDKAFPLVEGENLIGRHPSSAVWVDGASVSRHHARIVIAADRVTIEDRNSSNGTLVRGRKIVSPHPLVDGDVIILGSEMTTFRQWSDDDRAGTEPVRRRKTS